MKGLTYGDLVTHYGFDVCDNEPSCVYSFTAHQRGKVSHWRGDVMHWRMDRTVTRPGLITFLRAIARDPTSPLVIRTGVWREDIARECMWAQREAQERWHVTLPKNVFMREKSWLRGTYTYKASSATGLTIDDMTSPMYIWSHTQEEIATS